MTKETPTQPIEQRRRLLRVAEAAEYCSLDKATMYRFIQAGKFPVCRFTPDLIRIDPRDLDTWLESLKE